jgi:hypothetical protein
MLPTAEAVALAKGLAARACAERASGAVWPTVGPAVRWIEKTPLVALAILVGLCPEVAPERLAGCLNLDSHSTSAALESWRRRPEYPAEMVAVLLQQIAGGL